jgi:DNA modification methylase
MKPAWQILVGDCRERLRDLPDGSVHTVITSPPYFGLRDYGTGEWEGGDLGCDHLRPAAHGYDPYLTSTLGPKRDGVSPQNSAHANEAKRQQFGAACGKCGATRVDRQIGLEPTPDEFVQALVEVFREVRRVLRDDGTVWLNLGDSYAGSGATAGSDVQGHNGEAGSRASWAKGGGRGIGAKRHHPPAGLKPKDLIGIPWMVAFALRADGWYLRSDIIWAKPNPMPESVTDRPTKAHEYVFLLSKGPRYFYDADAIRGAPSPHSDFGKARTSVEAIDGEWLPSAVGTRQKARLGNGSVGDPAGRNKRSVWTVATQPYAGAHFATFPPKLIEPCVLAGCPERSCSACGAPWERKRGRSCPECDALVPTQAKECGECGYRNTDWREGRSVNGKEHVVDDSGRTAGRATPRFPGGFASKARDEGFAPSCSCSEAPAASEGTKRTDGLTPTPPSTPGTVLDPFAGAGTTGLVALRHNRSFVGIELNPGYAEMARQRIDEAVRLGFRPPERGPAVSEDQSSLFDEAI